MSDRLAALEATLQEGIKLSGQTSLGRRLPARASLALLVEARKGLRELSTTNANDPHVWRALSLAEETLLGYPQAIVTLEKAIALDADHDQKDLKRLAALRATAQEWNALRLTAVQLAQLGAYLDSQAELGMDFGRTREWLATSGVKTPAATVIAELEKRGARCDADVVEIARGNWV